MARLCLPALRLCLRRKPGRVGSCCPCPAKSNSACNNPNSQWSTCLAPNRPTSLEPGGPSRAEKQVSPWVVSLVSSWEQSWASSWPRLVWVARGLVLVPSWGLAQRLHLQGTRYPSTHHNSPLTMRTNRSATPMHVIGMCRTGLYHPVLTDSSVTQPRAQPHPQSSSLARCFAPSAGGHCLGWTSAKEMHRSHMPRQRCRRPCQRTVPTPALL